MTLHIGDIGGISVSVTGYARFHKGVNGQQGKRAVPHEEGSALMIVAFERVALSGKLGVEGTHSTIVHQYPGILCDQGSPSITATLSHS